MIFLILVCLVVRIFFLIFFMGNILFCRVILFVIVRYGFIVWLEKRFIKVVSIVILVDGLFLGMVFFGMWRWILFFLNNLWLMFNDLVLVLRKFRVVIVDFFIILFRLFVSVSLFLLGFRLFFINRILLLMLV